MTSRNKVKGYAKMKDSLKQYIRGWVEYYMYADAKSALSVMDQWLRRRIRMFIWKSWKNPKTRAKNLVKCGVPKWMARNQSYCKGYWRVAGSWIMTRAATNENLRIAGYTCLMDYYCRLHY